MVAMRWPLKHRIHGTEPRPVQIEAMKRANGRPRYGQWLQQRLGKTSLTLAEWINSNCDILLIVAPNSFKVDWQLAPEEWGLGGQQTAGYWPRHEIPFDHPRGVFCVNYESARTGAYRQLEELCKKRSVFLCIDESSAIKNPNSQTSRALIGLSKEAKMVRELNGTPITQNVLDYYAQLRCLGELNGVNPYAFKGRYAVTGGYMGKQIIGIKEDRRDELYALLNSCTFRALRKDWMPGHREPEAVTVKLEMTKRQLTHYTEMMNDFLTMVDGVEVSAEIVLTQMTRLQQLSSCLAMNGDNVSWIEQPKDNPKMKASLDVHEAGDGKTIIAYVYRASGDALFDYMSERGLKPARIRGQMKPEDIVMQKRRFNEDKDCRILVAQISAACMGHTLTGPAEDRCDRLLMYENSFNLRDRLQLQDRNYYDYAERGIWDFVASPMDELVVDALASKKNLADSVDRIVAAVRGAGSKAQKTGT